MNEENEPTLSKAVVEYEVKVLKLITGEEVVSKIRDLEDKSDFKYIIGILFSQ